MQNQQRKKNPSAFLRNIFNILMNPELNQYVAWAPQGNGFIIKNLANFQANILPQYFKHKKYSSFVRQLNMYGFHKQRNSAFENCFLHQQFKRGQQLPTDIKRKPEKKKKLNQLSSLQNVSKSQDWFSIGQQLRTYFPHLAQNILIKTQQKKQNSLMLVQERKLSIQNKIEIQKIKSQYQISQSEEYISKISLKGFLFDSQCNAQNENQSEQNNQLIRQNNSIEQQKNQPKQIKNPHIQSTSIIIPSFSKQKKNHVNCQQSQNAESQTIKSQYQQKQSNQLQMSQEKHSKSPSSHDLNDKNLSNIIIKQNNASYQSNFPPINLTMITFDSLNSISEMLLKQNQILIKTQPIIRNMILKSQNNKIKYLQESLRLEEIGCTGLQEVGYQKEDERFQQKMRNDKLNYIIQNQRSQIIKLTNLMEQELVALSQYALSQEYNPISTTSIRFRLQKNL